jgi:hypothetical protein
VVIFVYLLGELGILVDTVQVVQEPSHSFTHSAPQPFQPFRSQNNSALYNTHFLPACPFFLNCLTLNMRVLIQSIGNYSPTDTTLHPRRLESSISRRNCVWSVFCNIAINNCKWKWSLTYFCLWYYTLCTEISYILREWKNYIKILLIWLAWDQTGAELSNILDYQAVPVLNEVLTGNF